MKKMTMFFAVFALLFTLASCDIIEQEIERAESLKLEGYTVDIPGRSILLKITSNADEQVVERVIINDESYELVAQGNDWYLLENIPIAESYDIGNVYYLTGVGATVPYDVDFSITVEEAIDQLPEEYYTILDDTTTIGDYTFTSSETGLAMVESSLEFIQDEVDDWVWLIMEEDVPKFALVEVNEIVYIITAPENTADYLEMEEE